MSTADFQGDLQGGLAELRAYAEARMKDRVLIERSLGIQYNPATKRDEEAFDVVYADLPCRWQIDNAKEPRQVEVAGTTYTLGPIELHLPVLASVAAVTGLRATALTGENDPQMLGRKFWLVADHVKTDVTARRLGCQEV